MLATVRDLGIGFVAYSPLGRGFLTGTIHNVEDLAEDDWRRLNPRFWDENIEHNLRLVEAVRRLAAAGGAAPGQVALAWLLRQGEDIVPIPGTKRVRWLEENVAAVELDLPEEAWAELDEVLSGFQASGPRYPEAAMKYIDKTDEAHESSALNPRQRRRFDEQLEQVLAELPPLVHDLIERVPLHVEDYPSVEVMAELGVKHRDELCGLFTGVSLDQRSVSEGARLPDVVTIYREGVIAASADDRGRVLPARLHRQIRITILHELAHYHGLDEEELRELGYE